MQGEILGFLGCARKAHDPVGLEERAVQAADGDADALAVFPRQRFDSFRTPFS